MTRGVVCNMYPSLTTKKNFFSTFAYMNDKQIAQIALETGIDADILRKYIDNLIKEEGFEKGSVKKRVRSVSKRDFSSLQNVVEGNVYYENEKINSEPINKYVGDDVFFPYITNDKGNSGYDIGYGIKLKDKEGNFLLPEVANSEEDIQRLMEKGMGEKEYNSLFAKVVKDKILGTKNTYNKFIKNGEYKGVQLNDARDFDSLDDYEKLLMVDTHYNVGLTKFPKMMSGVSSNDMSIIGKEYRHFSGNKLLGSRNEMRKSFLIKNIAMRKNMFGSRLEEYMKSVIDSGQGMKSKLSDLYDSTIGDSLYESDLPFVGQEAMPDSTAMTNQEYTDYFLENTNEDNPYGPNQ